MAFENFKPILWSDKLFQAYDKAFVFSNLTNKDYEGEIKKYGQEVKINEIGEVTINDYTGSITYETPNDASKYLKIDQYKYFAVNVDDVDTAQMKPKAMNEIARKAGVNMADVIDQHIASKYTDAGIVSGSTGSPTAINSANITAQLRDIGTSMSENNVPNQGRVAVVPPWFSAKIDLAKIDKDTNNSATVNNAYVGRYLGFDIYESNNISHSGTTWYAPMFFTAGDSIAFALQLEKVEAGRRDGSFKDYLRALTMYGCKVYRPDSLAVLYCSEAAET
jgi:hypothetical protein